MFQNTSLKDFKEYYLKIRQQSSEFPLVPVIKETFADFETPVHVYEIIRQQKNISHSFILESAEDTSKSGRYSIIGFNPFLLFKSKNKKCHIEIVDKKFQGLTVFSENDPVQSLKILINNFSQPKIEKGPPLLSGAVGFIGYDAIRLIENVPFNVKADLEMDDIYLGFYNTFIIFDNLKRTKYYIYCVYVKNESDINRYFKEAVSYIENVEKFNNTGSTNWLPENKKREWHSNISENYFKHIVKKAKDYISEGDIFQVVLSQRFETDYNDDPFKTYRILRMLNPSPYMYFIHFDDFYIIGSSPELLVQNRNGKISTRPIAGTRPRGKNLDEDEKMAESLLKDSKELAEHIMLVDLGRNDLGRIAKPGTVKPENMLRIEKFSHVMHIVSDVSGELKEEKDNIDALFATFPAGTLSGAPKIRAMQIIDELEKTNRNIYGGSIGYFDFSGNMDWCIAIRTLLYKDGLIYVQAGAGIVADSNPDYEFQETVNKAQALKKAVEWS